MIDCTRVCREGCRRACVFVLQWHITEQCNLHCTHCYQGERSPGMDWDEVDRVLDQYAQLIDRLRVDHHCNIRGMITLTGGEPLLYPAFLELCRKIRERTFMLAVLTNGTLIDASMAQAMAELRMDFVQVSIDGDERQHDAIRGRGAYQKAVRGLKYLVAAGLNTSISFTVHQANYRSFPAVTAMAAAVGARHVWSDRLIPTGEGELLQPLTKEDFQAYLQIMQAEKIRYAGVLHVKLQRALQFMASGDEPYSCTAGRLLLTLLPDGTVYPCRRMPISLGTIQARSLAEIFWSDKTICALRDDSRVDPACTGCLQRKSCAGGLRCLSYARYGDPFRKDVNCPR